MNRLFADFLLMWPQAWGIMIVTGMAHVHTGELPNLSYLSSLALVVCANMLLIPRSAD